MIAKLTSRKSLIKKLNWILDSVNLSINLLEGSSSRKVYRILKKAMKYLEIRSYSKLELKKLAEILSKGELSEKEKEKIAKVILDVKYESQKKAADIEQIYSEPFLGTFFEKKQILRY